MFKYFVSSGLILNFMLFVFRRSKKKAHKECSDVFGICSYAYFYLDFFNCSLPEQIFNYNWIVLEEEKPFYSFELWCRDSS